MVKSFLIDEMRDSLCIHDAELHIGRSSCRASRLLVGSVADRQVALHTSYEFAARQLGDGQSADFYASYRDTCNNKAFRDIRNGKYGEWVACYYLRTLGFPKVVEPDTRIYDVSGKGWQCDLPYGEVDDSLPDVAVKTCSNDTVKFLAGCESIGVNGEAEKYSWTFQFRDATSGGRDELFSENKGNDLIVLVYVPFCGSAKPRVLATAPWSVLREHLHDPVAFRHKGKKKCIYYSDLLIVDLTASLRQEYETTHRGSQP